MQDINLVKDQICDVCHKMWQLGWVAANDGNVSAKLDDGRIIATPTGMSKSFITPEKLIIIAVAHKAMDMYNMIEDVAVIGSVPLTPYGTPSTIEVPNAIEPYLEEHDVMLLENHGALAVGSDVITAFYRMESLELWAKITINAVILGGSFDISNDNIQKLIDLRGYYQVTGRHPGHKIFNPDDDKLHKKD